VSDSDLSGTVLDGRYTVIEPIAEGAMGSVYRGERLKLGRAVAIKIMHEELPDELASRQRFEREAKLMALLEHPNCVSVIDFGVHDDKPFLVMDLVRGGSRFLPRPTSSARCSRGSRTHTSSASCIATSSPPTS
jgi:serine/threonine protein kinase